MNSAAVSFIGPLGFNRQLNRTDSVDSIGDSAFSASLGWEAGEHHWNIALTGFAPTGHYAPDSLAIMGLNRPGVDIKGAYTFLSGQTGTEVSGRGRHDLQFAQYRDGAMSSMSRGPSTSIFLSVSRPEWVVISISR
jgi:hypothetical protein